MKITFRWICLFAVSLSVFVFAVSGQSLTVAGWNIESGKSQNSAVAERIKEYQGIDIWGMSEVNDDIALQAVESAAEHGENANFERILSSTGGNDRLGIVYNSKRFKFIRKDELTNLGSGNQRAPLFAELEDKDTKKRFLFMVNHLARVNNKLRHQQAAGLNNWVKTQTLPVIAVGDYNFDWRVNNGEQSHDLGYDNMTKDGVWKWVRPETLIKTQCGGSVLDFVFVNKAAEGWNGKSDILTKENDCPTKYTNDLVNPDHRIVRAVFNLSGGMNKDDLLKRIEELEKEIKTLKQQVLILDN